MSVKTAPMSVDSGSPRSSVLRRGMAAVQLRPFSRRMRRMSIVGDPTWESWWRGFKASTRHAVPPRFSAEKARKFIAYRRNKSMFHQAMVLLLFPVPGLLAALIAPLIPLQDPSEGVLRNHGHIVHGLLTTVFNIAGAMMEIRAVTGISHQEYSNIQLALVAIIGSVLVVCTGVLMALAWRFPVPFVWIILIIPWFLLIVLTNVVVLGSQLRKSKRLRTRLLFAIPQLSVQLGQLVLYASYSAIFYVCSEWQQLVLIGMFPLVKMALKRLVFAVSHHLSDHAKETAISGVEISASMYQAMVMQSTPTPLATALVIGFDLVQGVLDVLMLMERSTVIPRRDLLETAFQMMDTNNTTARMGPLLPSPVQHTAVHPATGTGTEDDPRSIAKVSGSNKAIVTQALELLQSAETILLVEYIEVAVPTTNAIFLCIASQLQTALFNPQLRRFYGNYSELGQAIGSMMIYTGLQAMTLVLMCAVMRVRYRVSAFTLLAFVLEHHAWSLHGKMIAWLTSILEFSVIHYGVDFTFKFDFKIDN